MRIFESKREMRVLIKEGEVGEAYYVLNYDQPEASRRYPDTTKGWQGMAEIRDNSVAKLTPEITGASEG